MNRLVGLLSRRLLVVPVVLITLSGLIPKCQGGCSSQTSQPPRGMGPRYDCTLIMHFPDGLTAKYGPSVRWSTGALDPIGGNNIAGWAAWIANCSKSIIVPIRKITQKPNTPDLLLTPVYIEFGYTTEKDGTVTGQIGRYVVRTELTSAADYDRRFFRGTLAKIPL